MGKDPELKEFQSGTKKVTFSVAVSEGVKVKDKWENKTTWVLVEFWGRDAEYINTYAQKGSLIIVTGKIAEDTWEKDGETQRKFYIKGDRFVLPKTSNSKIEDEPMNDNVKNTNFDGNIPF